MGYESEVIIGRREDFGKIGIGALFNEEGRLYLGKLMYRSYLGKYFPELFNHEADFAVQMDNEWRTEDGYGDHLRWAFPTQLIPWLEAYCAEHPDWANTKMLLGMLKTLPYKTDIIIVHYGS